MSASEHNTDIKNDDYRQILDRLKTIRVGKTKVINMLATLKEKENQGEIIDRRLIQSLVDSYDRLKDQEEEFIVILRNISNFKEKEPKEQTSPDRSSTDDAQIDNELYEAVKGIRTASADSELASSIHRSLTDNIRLTQEKLDAMKLRYMNNLFDRTKIANSAIERRELIKLQCK